MRTLILLLLMFSTPGITSFAQNHHSIYNKSIQVDLGSSFNGTGEVRGYSLNTEFKKYFSKKLSFSVGLGTTLHDGVYENIYRTPDGKEIDGSYRWTIAGLQSTFKLGISFIRNRANDFGIQIGPLLRYQSNSMPDQFWVYYPALTNWPAPFSMIYHQSPQRTFSVGGIGQIYYDYSIGEKLFLGLSANFQTDSNEDILNGFALSVGCKL